MNTLEPEISKPLLSNRSGYLQETFGEKTTNNILRDIKESPANSNQMSDRKDRLPKAPAQNKPPTPSMNEKKNYISGIEEQRKKLADLR